MGTKTVKDILDPIDESKIESSTHSNKKLSDKASGFLKKGKEVIVGYSKLMAFFAVLFAQIIFFKSEYGSKVLDYLYDQTIRLLNHNKIEFILVFFVGHFVYNLTFLPGHTYFFVLMPYLLQDLWLSFFIIWVSYECSVIVGYFGIKKLFYKKFKTKWQNDFRYKLIKASVLKKPITYCSMVWMIIIPDVMKMICLTITDVPFLTYFQTSMPQYALQSFLYSLTGTTIKDFQDSASENGGWSNMTLSQKINFIITCTIILASFIVIMVWGYFVRRKIKEYKLSEMAKEEEIENEEKNADISESKNTEPMLENVPMFESSVQEGGFYIEKEKFVNFENRSTIDFSSKSNTEVYDFDLRIDTA